MVSTQACNGIPDADEQAATNTLTMTETDGRTTLSILVKHPTQGGARHAHRVGHGARPPGRARHLLVADRGLASLSAVPTGLADPDQASSVGVPIGSQRRPCRMSRGALENALSIASRPS